jgi:hypothetical protein
METLHIDITPNTKLLASLRNNNLTNIDAVADLIDNSIDADVNAKNVFIHKNKDLFVIADDGAGMDEELLIDAMKLGSAGRDKPAMTDLGLFGVGLKNSVLSLGRSTTIITKTPDGEHLTARFDIDDILAKDRFEIPMGSSSSQEIIDFGQYTKGSASGTVILIRNLDKVIYTTDGNFRNALKKQLAETFRVFIKDGLNIYVDEVLVRFRDPLSTQYAPEAISQTQDEVISLEMPDGTPFKIRVKITYMPELLKDVSWDYTQSMENQGIYFMRNDRQIQRATWQRFATKHGSLNRTRGEIYFSGDLDDIFGVPYEKNSVKLKDWFLDKLKPIIGPVINNLKNRYESETKSSRKTSVQEQEDIKQLEENIDKKANRISRLKVNGPSKLPAGTKRLRLGGPSSAAADTDIVDVDSKEAMGKHKLVEIDMASIPGPYICTFEPKLGGSLRVVINTDHDFYTKFYAFQELGTRDAFTKLLFALGRTITSMSDETEAYAMMMDDFQRNLGETFRKLMS